MPEDYDAFRLIYETYWKKVYNYAQKILEENLLAEDVVQQVFVSLWERREFLQIENIEGYLIKAVKFACITELKKRYRCCAAQDCVINCKKTDLQTDDHVLYKDLEKTIDKLLCPMAHKCQKMFRMRFEQGMDNRSIALHFDLSEKTVRNKLSRTIGIIREKLKIEGYK
ncbi:MAG: sigma-70 family RNA polymerase sigma factor [Pedobacter sp.]|uniref:sigma-70 family RNA polymerase sigma factor n=1 Tax=Pedobacter sp. TaxID=1411316 RepID=UPI003569DADE